MTMAVVPALKGTTLAPNRPTRPEAQSNRSSTVVLTYDEVTSLLHGLDFQSSDGLALSSLGTDQPGGY
jgi:hypothetical protein